MFKEFLTTLNYLGTNIPWYSFLSFALPIDESVSLSSSYYFCICYFHFNLYLNKFSPFISFNSAFISKSFSYREICFPFLFHFIELWFISIWWNRAHLLGFNYESSHGSLIKTLLFYNKVRNFMRKWWTRTQAK